MLQDEAWQRRNRLTVTGAAVPHEVPVTGAPTGGPPAALHHLSAAHNAAQPGATVLGTWLFVEKLHVSDINANVTITLSSNIAALLNHGGGGGGGDDDGDGGDAAGDELSPLAGSQVLHIVKSSGFQLINVTNVAMQLKARICLPCSLQRQGCRACEPRMCASGAAGATTCKRRRLALQRCAALHCSKAN